MTLAPRRTRPRRAMTLIELLIVVTVIGIMTSVAMWKIDIARYQINGDMQSMGTALIAAQREAVAKQYNIIVVFDSASSNLRVIWDANDNGQLDGTERSRPVLLSDRVRFGIGTAPAMGWGASGIGFSQKEPTTGLPSVTFYRNGSASEASGFYLTSTRAQASAEYAADVRAIRVERATGRPEWWHYDGTKWLRGF